MPSTSAFASSRYLSFGSWCRCLAARCSNKRIADNTLVALTLMIAESRTEEKDVMVKVVVNLINKNYGLCNNIEEICYFYSHNLLLWLQDLATHGGETNGSAH
jgi:hypothetical protein